jgi:hypothetical protein
MYNVARGSKLWSMLPGKAAGLLGGRVVCMKNMFTFNEYGRKIKYIRYFGRHFAWLK